MTDELRSRTLQFRAHFTEVVYLAVVNDPVPRCRIAHGLMGLGRKIENGQPSIAEANFDCPVGVTQNDCAAVVRPAMGERARGPVKYFRWDQCIRADDSDDSAHSKFILREAPVAS